jgi:hypothetical protein
MNIHNTNKVTCSQHGTLFTSTDIARCYEKAEAFACKDIPRRGGPTCDDSCVYSVNGEVVKPKDTSN